MKSIILGKKCYWDKLESVKDKNITGDHIRMKGVGESVIKYEAESQNTTIEQLYMRLYNNEEINFDIAKGRELSLKISIGTKVEEVTDFSRKVKFPGKTNYVNGYIPSWFI